MEMILTDLDELVLTVRDRNCRVYISEAVAAYRVRAYRAAVVSTWIAVSFDVISKIRELANQGEKAAIVIVSDLDKAIAERNVVRMQAIEGELLAHARDKFEFLGGPETKDLERLKEDRNACAHPAFAEDNLLFTPTPEAVRAHIVHAISHLLRHPPIQGKAALSRIKADILQPSFPADQDGVTRYLSLKYLDRAKPSLIDTLIVVFLKVLLKGADAELAMHGASIGRCLRAIGDRFPSIYSKQMSDQLPRLTDGADDKQLFNLFVLLGDDPRAWDWLDEPTKLRVHRLAEGLKDDDASDDIFLSTSGAPSNAALLLYALAVPALRDSLMKAFRGLKDSTQEMIMSQTPRPELGDEAIRLYHGAKSFRHAESLGTKVLIPMSPFLTAEQVRKVLLAIEDNAEIWYASGSPEIIEKFFDRSDWRWVWSSSSTCRITAVVEAVAGRSCDSWAACCRRLSSRSRHTRIAMSSMAAS